MGSLWLKRQPLSNHLPPMPGFPKDLETHLVYGQMRQMSSLRSPQVSNGKECRQFALYHVTSQTGHSPHLCDTHNGTGHRRTDHQNGTSATALRFSFRVFWTFSFQHGVWKGSSSALCLRDGRGKETAVQRLSKFWSVL